MKEMRFGLLANDVKYHKLCTDQLMRYEKECGKKVLDTVGGSHIVQEITMFSFEKSCEIISIIDINAFASEDEAYAYISRLYQSFEPEGEYVYKHAYIVEYRTFDDVIHEYELEKGIAKV